MNLVTVKDSDLRQSQVRLLYQDSALRLSRSFSGSEAESYVQRKRQSESRWSYMGCLGVGKFDLVKMYLSLS
jgi:hypothetical protein